MIDSGRTSVSGQLGCWPVLSLAAWNDTCDRSLGIEFHIWLAERKLCPEKAFYDAQAGEFILMYDEVRRAPPPNGTLMEFLQSTYEAAATLAKRDRAAREKAPEQPAAGAA